ncbi:MAG: hypothetical protein PHX38_11635 [Sulfuricella sp.]|nr:hypothetical protein [Sulfuricella sp.]
MRLSPAEASIIRQAVAESFGSGARVRLFGSRVDDAGRGGDVDLYVEPGDRDDLYLRRIRCLARLAARLPYPVDLVLADEEGLRPIDRVAVATGVEL